MNTEDATEKLEKMEKEMRKNMENMRWGLCFMTFSILFMLTAILFVVGPMATGRAAFNTGEIFLMSSLEAILTGFLVWRITRPPK